MNYLLEGLGQYMNRFPHFLAAPNTLKDIYQGHHVSKISFCQAVKVVFSQIFSAMHS